MQDRWVRKIALTLFAASLFMGCGLVVSLDGLEGAKDGATADSGTADALPDATHDISFGDGTDGGWRPSPNCGGCFAKGERCCEHYGTTVSCVAIGAACGKDTVMNWGCFRPLGCGADQACCIVEDFHDDSGPVGSPMRSECAKTPCLWPAGFGDQWRLCETEGDCRVGEKCVGETVYTGPPSAQKEVAFFHCK